MKIHVTTETIVALLDGVLPESEQELIRLHIANCKKCKEAYNELQKLQEVFVKEIAVEPSEKAQNNFNEMLAEEIAAEASVLSKSGIIWLYPVLKVAAIVAVMVGSFLLGKWYGYEQLSGSYLALKEDNVALKTTATMSLMESTSASKRIEGITRTNDFVTWNQEVIDALTFRMLFDENDNVRLVAAQSMEHMASDKLVRSSFIEALGKEKNPMIQIELIEIIARIREKGALENLKQLRQSNTTLPLVKAQIDRVIPEIM
ncbi:zf-HC2 domain-containing protein [Neptunitalea lumnitzerae]|uniref:Putative zinc-finger domain-containing protein n=1 Tax=Neptunitalea lumnitzerae TaxID=2965509 RepID=A0ABQ5MGB0_9FLAO|nr:zf-HC2 domain-containing protein [Neptunitalea sp. Y10]GLB48451.1 hypothetical protein Y10_08190 [Neptunitalea sp. Y10]